MATKTFCDLCDREIQPDVKRYFVIIAETKESQPPGFLDTLADMLSLPPGGNNTVWREVCTTCKEGLIAWSRGHNVRDARADREQRVP